MDLITIKLIEKHLNLPFDILKYVNTFLLIKLTDQNFLSVIKLWFSNEKLCLKLYGHISTWNTIEITNMDCIFIGRSFFNLPLYWNVKNVQSMNSMFAGARLFNQDISFWNVSKVTNMKDMFNNATSFHSDLSRWNVSNVINMNHMFYGAKSFNSDLSKWNVNKVIDMDHIFDETKSLKFNINQWKIPNESLKIQTCFDELSLKGGELCFESNWTLKSPHPFLQDNTNDNVVQNIHNTIAAHIEEEEAAVTAEEEEETIVEVGINTNGIMNVNVNNDIVQNYGNERVF